jgi:hypothetical protein
MNAAYFHLVPTYQSWVSYLDSLFLLALIRKSTEVRSVALWVFVLAALSAAPVFLTGASRRPGGKGTGSERPACGCP